MGHHRHNPYLAAGLTAFAVITGALLLFFLLFHFQTVAAFLGTIAGILRPIFMGAVIAFLLVPVHRWISGLLLEAAPKNRRVRRALNFLSILLSLALAILLIYVLLAMVIPQVWQSIVDLVLAVPDYIVDFQSWLRTFLEDNPDIQSAALSVYASFAASLEQCWELVRTYEETGVPVMFGVLTTDTIEQAIERAGTKAGNKGFACAEGAIEMVNLIRSMEE